ERFDAIALKAADIEPPNRGGAGAYDEAVDREVLPADGDQRRAGKAGLRGAVDDERFADRGDRAGEVDRDRAAADREGDRVGAGIRVGGHDLVVQRTRTAGERVGDGKGGEEPARLDGLEKCG